MKRKGEKGMGWRKIVFGEGMPSRDDPAYRERYLSEVAQGRKWAGRLGLDRVAMRVQAFAARRPLAFLLLAFGMVAGCLAFNVCRLVAHCARKADVPAGTVSCRQEQAYRDMMEVMGDVSDGADGADRGTDR